MSEHRFRDKIIVCLLLSLILYFANTYLFSYKDNVQAKVLYYKQETNHYCAEACIQMMLDYYHVTPLPSQHELAFETKYKDNETKSAYMGLPFDSRNMTSKISCMLNYEQAYDQLINTVSEKPVIILLYWGNGTGHYIVVYAGDSRGITYHDPSKGASLSYTREELKKYWHDNYNSSNLPCWALSIK